MITNPLGNWHITSKVIVVWYMHMGLVKLYTNAKFHRSMQPIYGTKKYDDLPLKSSCVFEPTRMPEGEGGTHTPFGDIKFATILTVILYGYMG